MYDQKLEDAIAARRAEENKHVRVNMKPFTVILSAEDSSSTSDDTSRAEHGIHVTLQNALTHALTEQTYDAVICGTGYDRTSWINLLNSSSIGKYFGLHASSAPVELHPSTELPADYSSVSETPKPSQPWQLPSGGSSESSTPLTSPSLSPSLTNSRLLPNTKLYITRNYRLIPVDSAAGEKPFAPKVYLQGCTETTHGLSESLLSILGVRSGLVVNDLFAEESA